MGRRLGETEKARYAREGYLFPLRVLPAEALAACRARFDALVAREGGALSPGTNHKPHLLLPWLHDLVRHPAILDAVEDLLGPDLLVWGSGFFAKPPRSPGYVSWHQDSTYWGLSRPDVVTAWVAFTPSGPANGGMRVIPGSHRRDQLPHRDTFADANMLSRGQEVLVEVDEREAVDVTLQPGEMSLHHVRIVHGSGPNPSDGPRIGYTIRYVPTSLRQLSDVPDSATLVRGTDTYGHFLPEPAPAADFHPDAVAFHAAMLERSARILYDRAERRRGFAAGR
jgi:hypothetical protein